MSDLVSIVTGGAGFIGLNLVEKLLDKGLDVVVIDNLTTGSNLPELTKLLQRFSNLRFINASVLDDSLGNLLETIHKAGRPVEVYHLAASSHVDRSISSPMGFVVDNVLGTACVLEACRKFPTTSLLVVSTDEVYGDEGPFPSPLSSPIKASSPYSATKAGADLLVKAYRRTFNMPVKISRCCNNFGRHQHREKFLPTILNSIVLEQPIPVYGTGKQMRQWVPVEVHADRLIEFMRGGQLDQHVGGYSMSNLDMIQEIAAITGKHARWNRVKDRPGHDTKYELLDQRGIGKEVFVEHLKRYVENETTKEQNR